MAGLTQKYFGRQNPDVHGGPVTWPGNIDGFPLQGEYSDYLKQDEVEELGNVAQFKAKLFHTWVPEELEEFVRIQDFIANGLFYEHRRLDRWDTIHDSPVVWLEWKQIYSQSPKPTGEFTPMGGR